ncbi:hypothetical protein [Halorubrum sp. SY-15]|uniref:hypothetical protein n=1 Tax=Halorubrum sp. SY-15 TaxID=3402277 RepID=UPI003EBB7249
MEDLEEYHDKVHAELIKIRGGVDWRLLTETDGSYSHATIRAGKFRNLVGTYEIDFNGVDVIYKVIGSVYYTPKDTAEAIDRELFDW